MTVSATARQACRAANPDAPGVRQEDKYRRLGALIPEEEEVILFLGQRSPPPSLLPLSRAFTYRPVPS